MKQSQIILAVIAVVLIFIAPNGITYSMQYKQNSGLHKEWMRYTEEFYQKSGSFCSILYTEEDISYIASLQRALDIYYELLAHDFQEKKQKNITVILYPSKVSMSNALGMEWSKVPMGMYYGGCLHILSPAVWAKANNLEEYKVLDIFLEEGPIVHELAHYFLDSKTNGNYPVFFAEGVALYYEKKYTGFDWRPDLSEASKSISADALINRFQQLDTGMSYRRSLEIIEKMVDLKGEESLHNIIQQLAKGKGFLKAFEKEFQVGLASFDEKNQPVFVFF